MTYIPVAGKPAQGRLRLAMLFDVFNGAPPGRNLERCRRAAATTKVLVDFEVAQSFVLRGNSLAQNGLLFKPVMRGTLKPRLLAEDLG